MKTENFEHLKSDSKKQKKKPIEETIKFLKNLLK